MVSKKKKPVVIYLDIETSPILGYTWEMFEANVLKIIEPSKILSFAYKEMGDKEVTVKCLADYKGYKKDIIDDKHLVEDLWNLLDRADVIIGHNLDSFDIKKIQTRFIFYGLNAPSSFKTVDTLKVAKKYFKFESNSLNSLCTYLGLGEKVKHSGFSLWVQCMAGDPESWEKMKEYNAGDILLQEQIYLKLRPHQTNHPNLTAILGGSDVMCCPTCQSTMVTKRGFSVTRTGRKQRYQCNECASWSTGPYQKIPNMLSGDDD